MKGQIFAKMGFSSEKKYIFCAIIDVFRPFLRIFAQNLTYNVTLRSSPFVVSPTDYFNL